MNTVSWNLNGLLSCVKNNSFVPLAKMMPDIICFQEIRTQQEPIIIEGYNHYWNTVNVTVIQERRY